MRIKHSDAVMGRVDELLDKLKGWYQVCYSKDDYYECGRGYYAELWWLREGNISPNFTTHREAIQWAENNGGTNRHIQEC